MYAVNYVPLVDMTKSETGCCTLIDPSDWDEQTFTFDNKLFMKVRTSSLFHIPLNMSAVMRRAQAKINEQDAAEKNWMILSHETTLWHADHYFAVSKEVEGMEHARLSGTFVTKVFDGPFKDAPKWHAQLMDYVRSLGKETLDTYFFYTLCPKCAATYGKNYVVGFAKVA